MYDENGIFIMYDTCVFSFIMGVMSPNQYQGNVSTEPLKQTPYQDYVAPNYYNPYSNM